MWFRGTFSGTHTVLKNVEDTLLTQPRKLSGEN